MVFLFLLIAGFCLFCGLLMYFDESEIIIIDLISFLSGGPFLWPLVWVFERGMSWTPGACSLALWGSRWGVFLVCLKSIMRNVSYHTKEKLPNKITFIFSSLDSIILLFNAEP